MIQYKQFSLDSAHFMPGVPAGHKCGNMHGHTYALTVFIEGEPNLENGWIIDFSELNKNSQPVIDLVDHQVLNTIHGL